MIDFHTHILPHLDDGAKDTAMAKAMLEAEFKQGVTDVLFTPHYYGRRHSPSQFIEKRDEAWAHLKPNVPEGLTVHLGAEVHFTGVNVPDYDELCKLVIRNTKYILIEFPFTNKWTHDLLEKLGDFVYETGYTPIIAHVERYHEVLGRPSYLTELIDMGCLLQVNASAFEMKKERGLVLAMLKRGWIHCIGTDTHDMGIRKPNLLAAKNAMEEAGFGESWDKIQATMQAILRGEEVKPQMDKPIKKFFGKYI